MAKNAIKRLLSTGVKTYSGILGAQIKAAQEEEERRRIKNQETMAALLGHSLVGQRKASAAESMARMKAIDEPEPEKSDVKWKFDLGPGIKAETTTPEGLREIAAGLGVDVETLLSGIGGEEPPIDAGIVAQPKDITGIGEFEDVVSRRKKETEKGRKEAKEKIIERFGSFFRDKGTDKLLPGIADATPEELIALLRKSIPETTEKTWKLFSPRTWGMSPETVPDPAYEAMEQGLSGIQVPPEYQIPMGDAAVALQDSINIGRQDPAMAAAIMNLGGVAEEPQPERGISPVRMPTAGAETFHGARTFKGAQDGIENLYRHNEITKAQRDQGIADAKVFFGVK